MFIECDKCRAKLGSPTLCGGCIQNRQTIALLQEALSKFKEANRLLDKIEKRIERNIQTNALR